MRPTDLLKKYLLWSVYFVLIMTPLIFLPFVYRQFDIGKSVPFKIAMGIIIIVFSLWQMIKPDPELWTKKIRAFFPFLIPTALLSFNYLFSTFMCDDIWMSVVGLYERQIGTSGFFLCVSFAFFIILLATKNEGYSLGLRVLKIMTFILGMASVLQYFQIYDFMLRDPPAGRSNALLGNANFLGDQIVFFTPFFLSFYFLAKTKYGKFFNAFAYGICSLGIFVTGTRSAYLGLAVSFLAFLFVLLIINDAPEKRKVNKIFLNLFFGILIFVLASLLAIQWDNYLLILAVLPLMAFLVWGYFRFARRSVGETWRQCVFWFLALVLASSVVAAVGASFRQDAPALNRYYSLFYFSGKATPRFSIWKDGLTFIRDIPFWGVGPEMFREKFMSYKSKETEELEPHTHYDNPHNNYLYILFSLGPIGLLLHLWILGRFLKMNFSLITDIKRERKTRLIAAGFLTTMISYAVWTIPGFEFLSSIASFWALIGIFCIFYASVKEEEQFFDLNLFARFKNVLNIFKQKFVSMACYTTLIILSAWLIFDNYCIFMGDIHFVDGLINRGRGQFRSSIDDFEKALTYNPRESYYFLHVGKSYADLIQRETDFEMKKRYAVHAEEALDKGLLHAWSPDLIYATKANVRLGLGDREGAIAAMNRVIEVYPATIEYRKFLNYIINDPGK